MLDAFKKTPGKPVRQQADELEALIATSRGERAALSTMLTQIQLHVPKLASAGKSLQEVEEAAGKAQARSVKSPTGSPRRTPARRSSKRSTRGFAASWTPSREPSRKRSS